jgi:hypothetical protein
MVVDPTATPSSAQRRSRLVEERVDEMLAVRHHTVFGMHVDPLAGRPVGEPVGNPDAGPSDDEDPAHA